MMALLGSVLLAGLPLLPALPAPAPDAAAPVTRARFRHGALIATVAFSPDGTTLAAASWDRSVLLWDAATGREVRRCQGHTLAVAAVAFAPDGRTLVSGGDDHTVRLWDAATGQEVRRLLGHQDQVTAVAFAPDGRTLASADRKGRLCLWDVAAGRLLRQFEDGGPRITGLAFAPDGRTLAAGGCCGGVSLDSVWLWDPDAGKLLRRFGQEGRGTNAVAFSPDGRTLATANDDGHVYLWEVATGRQRLRLSGHQGYAKVVAFAPDGRTVASAPSGTHDRAVRLWELATGEQRLALDAVPEFVSALAFGPDGRTLATGGDRGTGCIWDLGGRTTAVPRPRRLTRGQLQSLWDQLITPDAPGAYRALWVLAGAPGDSIPFVRDRLRELARAAAPDVPQLLADLDNNRFAVRQKATRELEKLGWMVEADLRRALAGPASLEVSRRAEQLLQRLEARAGQSPNWQALRGLEVLEQAGTAEARRALEGLAREWPKHMPAQEAEAALRRLARRPGPGS
jgi:dipeptidyl aminopeptidase/acylaminoacyl peptidase